MVSHAQMPETVGGEMFPLTLLGSMAGSENQTDKDRLTGEKNSISLM